MSQNPKSRSIASCIPNSLTALGLLCGLIATVFATQCYKSFGGLTGTEWTWIFIGGALIFDYIDGLSARLLDAYSDLGKNLDSLSDLISFGVAPALLLYNIIDFYHPGWSFVTWLPLLIPIAGAFRLARFNIDPNQKSVFMGLPIPANAIFWVGFSPLLIQNGEMPAWVATFCILALSFLMVSPMPMFSLKIHSLKLDLDNVLRILLLLATVALVLCLGIQGLLWVIVVYLVLSFISFFGLVKEQQK